MSPLFSGTFYLAKYQLISKPSSTLNYPVHIDYCQNEECGNHNKKASYHPASLHAIDRFFMITIRKISTLESPISSQGTVGRKWNSTSSYSPEVVEKRLIMLRTYRNYVFVGDDGKTPAMRLGLANKPYDLSQFIHRN